jgi:hypothetical protein
MSLGAFVWHDRAVHPVSTSIAAALTGIAALHVAWAVGSSFPFADRSALADTVSGQSEPPGPGPTLVVAAMLLSAAGAIADVLPIGTTTRRSAVLGTALVLGGRGVIGVAGRTGRIVPWTPSARFNQLDKRYYGPLCLLLAGGALRSIR